MKLAICLFLLSVTGISHSLRVCLSKHTRKKVEETPHSPCLVEESGLIVSSSSSQNIVVSNKILCSGSRNGVWMKLLFF